MSLFQQILFLVVAAIAGYLFIGRIIQIRKNILLGRDEDRRDQPSKRLRSMLLVAFGQKKMFKKPIPAFLHLLIYIGFIVINIEGIEFFMYGVLGKHRTIAELLVQWDLTGLYTTTFNIFESLAFLVILSCVFFLIRRNVFKIKRFSGPEMTHWPKLDANLILIFEILLMFAIMTMNATDQILQD